MTLGYVQFADAGQLDHPFTLLGFVTTEDEYGQPIETWGPIATDWCELVPLGTRERFGAQQLQGVIDYVLRIRWRADVTEQNRVQLDGIDYDLAGPPVERGRHQYLELAVRRRAAGMPTTAAAGATLATAGAPPRGDTEQSPYG
jgi:SPP1 family predicted phage head-tail adaptor